MSDQTSLNATPARICPCVSVGGVQQWMGGQRTSNLVSYPLATTHQAQP
jgi:hypothetical protein